MLGAALAPAGRRLGAYAWSRALAASAAVVTSKMQA